MDTDRQLRKRSVTGGPGKTSPEFTVSGLLFSVACLLALLAGQPARAAVGGEDVCSILNQVSGISLKETRQDGNWSDPATWGGTLPSGQDDVVVGHRVTVAGGTARQVQIRGELTLAGLLDVHGSVLVCADGRLQGQTGTLAIHVEDDRQFAGNTRAGPVRGYPDFHPQDIGLWVLPGGSVMFDGEPVTSWLDAVALDNTRARRFQRGVLRTTAFDNGRAKLAQAPTGWQRGDSILLVNEKGENALATLESVAGQDISYQFIEQGRELEGYVLEVDSELEPRSVNPKVANLSRRLQIIGADVAEGDFNHRPHTVYMRGATVSLTAVEFRNLGPRAKLGRYPVHWHHNGETDGVLSGSSIWQSVDDGGNRFVTMHMVSGATVSDNVGYRSQGHGYFMEEFTETGNRVTGNLSVDVRHTEELPNVDSQLSGVTHHFWLRSGNQIVGNVAAGHSWNGKGLGNRAPYIEGLVVLPSSAPAGTTLVSDFECLGCGGVGMWTAVPDTVFENPVSSYATTAGFRAYEAWNFDASGAVVKNPLFILNGNDDLFAASRDYQDKVPWASQIYLNYGAVSVEGGTLVGKLGIHSHYSSRLAVKDTLVIANIAIDPTYWDSSAIFDGVTVDADNLFTKGYGAGRRASPGAILFRDSCFKKNCRNSRALESVGYSSNFYADVFADYRKPLSYGTWVELDGSVGETGFIRVPEDLGAKYWSVTPRDSGSESRIMLIRESEAAWQEYRNRFGGFMDGFPPGEYQVNLYASDSPDSLLVSKTVTVSPGQLSSL